MSIIAEWMRHMQGYNLVAVYDSLDTARRVSDRLLAEGIAPADVRMTRVPETTVAEPEPAPERHRDRGFFDWLFAADVPEYDRNRYTAHLGENRAAVSVRAADRHWHDRIVAIMEEFNPIDIEEDGHALTGASRAAGTASFGAATVPQAGTTARSDLDATARADARATMAGERTAAERTGLGREHEFGREHEEVIPVVKEELEIGKRSTEKRYRVRSYVIEHPVEKTATVRDERVEIEHRPVSRTHLAAGTMPQEREIEVVERHEQPFAAKRVRADEEIVVRKEVTERPETVRGTVRETKVEVEEEPAAPERSPQTPAGRTANTPGSAPRGTPGSRR